MCARRGERAPDFGIPLIRTFSMLAAGLAVAAGEARADATADCWNGNSYRRIELRNHPRLMPSCEVWYTRDLEEPTRSYWAGSTPSICTDGFAELRETLERSGYACEISGDPSQAAEPSAPLQAPADP